MSDTFPTVFLIGLRGSGKTTLAKELAQEFSTSFVDTDTLVQESENKSIAQIVADEGWESFRKKETKALYRSMNRASDITDTNALNIVATGGGIVLNPINCDFMRRYGQVFYLNAPWNILVERLEKDPLFEQRPELVMTSMIGTMDKVLTNSTLGIADMVNTADTVGKGITNNLHAEMKTLYKERHKFYKYCAHHVLDAEKSSHEVLIELCNFLQIKAKK